MLPADDWSVHNASDNPTFEEVLDGAISRRTMLRSGLHSGLGAAAALWLAGCADGKAPASRSMGIASSDEDHVRLPEGYEAEVLFAWGDPVGAGPAWKPDASDSAATQARQAGMHHDGMEYLPLAPGAGEQGRGLLCINHEYTDDGLLHPGGMVPWTSEKVRKSQAAHGVSVIEVACSDRWRVDPRSAYARRITATTPIEIRGPAAGHAWMRTRADPTGTRVLGTLNNCASGKTPWGTYLTCEENFHGYFHHSDPDRITDGHRRYGIGSGSGYRWHEHDERFAASKHPNEPNRFGWVVEIDPRNPDSIPIKRTALGRCRHENAAVTLTNDGRAVVYMGDDAVFEYIYRFVSVRPYDPENPDPDLLDDGTLYVARFAGDGTGEWIALDHHRNGLDRHFGSQAEICIHTRQAADHVGATKMDRAEWIAIHPQTGETYTSLTNNAGRTRADPANPRVHNAFGHIIRWRPEGGDHGADAFAWDVFLLAGNPAHPDPAQRGNVKPKQASFGWPDGLRFDPMGRLWIQTDIGSRLLGRGDCKELGNNQLLVADPATGFVRRFMTGPCGCEVTGAVMTPDCRSLFVNLQHPGEVAGGRCDPARPDAVSRWPSGEAGARPRSATIVIRRKDGGIVGT